MTLARRALSQVVVLGLIATLLVACSGSGTGGASPSPAPASPAASAATSAAVPSPSTAAAPIPTVSSAAVIPSPRPDVTFTSHAYRYRARIPGDLAAGDMVAATETWDGEAQIDSTGPRTDHAYLADQRLLFAYGAPTDLDVDAWATAAQAQKAAWHGCPAVPDTSTPTIFGGTTAVLASFPCGGLHVLAVYAVKDGFGLAVNLLSPPGHEAEDAAVLERILKGWSWSG